MDFKGLDRLLDHLKEIIPPAPPVFTKATRHDWRPFWALAGEIQEAFRSGVRYPTLALREAAWHRFNALRDEATHRSAGEREALRSHSENLRNILLADCRGITYSPVSDAIFFFDPTTATQVKAWQRYLAEAMQKLSKWKHEMLGEHKQQCFERFQEVKSSHELFWKQHREAHQARHEASQAEWRSKKRAIASKIEANLDKNREQFRKTTEALNRNRARADELRGKIRDTTSSKWEGIFETWLAETEAKIDDIERHLNQIQEWIEEGERRLRDLRGD